MAAKARTPFYRAAWRWHFYAGLISIPVIALLCTTGIVWLFSPQIDGLIYGHARNVEPGRERISYTQQEKIVRAAYPGGTVSRMAPPVAADKATVFDITTKDGTAKTVYLDPYTGEISGERNTEKALTQIALELHGSLMTARWLGDEKWGDTLMELTASWALVLVITGLILWWPRGRSRSFREALTPRWRGRERRTSWRNVHAVTGVLFSFVTLFFILTGLMWTGGWGARYSDTASRLGSDYPPEVLNGVESKPVSAAVQGGKAGWAASGLPASVPSGHDHSTHSHSGADAGFDEHRSHQGHANPQAIAKAKAITWDPKDRAPLDAVVARAEKEGMTGYSILFPPDDKGSFQAVKWPDMDVKPNQSALDSANVYIDQRDATTLANVRFSDYGMMAQASSWGISVHEGREWGLVSQLLMLVASLAILVSLATSVVMWRKRKPDGLGAPRRPPSKRASLLMIAIAGGLEIVFPILGWSLLAILVFEFFVLRRIPPLARALGA